MMDNLSDLMSCCRGLDTDKVTERKKSVEKLRQLLDKNSVIKSLDRNTDEKCARNNNRLITWDDVFMKGVVLYIRLETAALQKAKESVSAAAKLNKEKKKQEISGFFKFFVRVADKRGPRLKCSNVLSHINEILEDDYTCAAYGLDYSTILLKNVLPVRKYWVDIKSRSWHDLLLRYCRLYLDPDCSIDRVVLVRLVRTILSGAARQCDLQHRNMLVFFTEVFKNIRQEPRTQVLEHLLSALNVFVRKIAPSCRIQICKLGETIFINLLYLWNNRPTDLIKDEIVEFLRLQMQAHHPGGVKTPETGELTLDKELWRSHLRKLYEVMYTDLQEMGGRNRFTTGTREAVLKAAYVDLAADVCNQLFTESSQTIEVTQMSMLGDGDTPRKKRRLESGWTVVRDTMYNTGCSHQVIPWLQLVTRLVEKYPSSVPEDELLPLLQCLHKLLNDCRRSEILRHIFQCLIVLVSSYTSFTHITMATVNSTRDIWQTIWSSTLRSMSSHQAEAEGYQQLGFNLLAAIVHQEFVCPEKDVWNLFLPNVSSPNMASIHFLSVCLSLHDLPENHQPSILGSNFTAVKGSYTLRKHLFDWLIPKRDVSDVPKVCKIDPVVMSQVLVALTVRNPGSVIPVESASGVRHWTELEKIYLETSFDCEMRIEKVFRASGEKGVKDEVAVVPSLLETLKQVFTREVSHFQTVLEPQQQTLELIITCSSVLTKCIHLLLDTGVASPAMLADTGLEACLKTLLRKMASFLLDYVKKGGSGQMLPIIQMLQTLFPRTEQNTQGCYMVSELLRSLLPGSFFDLMFEIAFSKLQRSNSNSNNSSTQLGSLRRRSSFERRPGTSDRGRSRYNDIDEMDLDFEDVSRSAGGDAEDMDFDEVDDIGDSQDSDETHNTHGCPSLVSEEGLTETCKQRLEAVRLLCLCCNYESSVAPSAVPYKAEMETSFIKNKLAELLDGDMFDTGRAVDLLSMDAMVRALTTQYHNVSDTDLENMVDAVRRVIVSQRRDQEVCCLCLDLITQLAPHLTDPDNLPSSVKKECREITLKLLSAFCKLRGEYAAAVRLSMAKCMRAFMQCDPTDEWSVLTMKKDEDEADESISTEFHNCLLDTCHVTCLYVAEALQNLFVIPSKDGLQPKPAQQQHAAFDLLYQDCNELMIFKERKSVERQQDEVQCRTSTLLTVLATVACSSPVSEKKSMFALCQLIREKGIAVDKVLKVLRKVSVLLGYTDVTQYICSHLPYLLNQWLELEYPLSEFPYSLLGVDSLVTFFRSYGNVLVPGLFMHGLLEDIQALASDAEQGWKQVIIDSIPNIVIHILPLFAASTSEEVASDREVKKRTSLASRRYDMLEKEVTSEVIDREIHANLDVIIVNILMCLHGTGTDEADGSCCPDPNPPSYNSYIIKSTLDYLTNSFSGSTARSLVSVLAKTQDSIQRVLLKLATSLSTEHRIQEKRRILTMYQLFVEMLLPEFASTLGGSWGFILRDVIHRLVHVIKDINTQHRDIFVSDHDSRLSMMETCIGLLHSISTVALESCPEELGKYLDCIVSTTLPLVRRRGPLQDSSQTLLNLLIMENTGALRDAIGQLDSFPEEYEFSNYRKVHRKLQKHAGRGSLIQEMQHTVKVLQEKQTVTEGCTQTLLSLNSLFCQSRSELRTLTTDSQNSTDGPVLCQLVCELLHLTQSPCHQVALEAASCLGIIGPINLYTLSLPKKCPQPGLQDSLEAYQDKSDGQKYCRIFHCLNQYLVDPCITVVQRSGEVLKSMLATRLGVEFSNNYKARLADKDYLFNYLHPFKCKKKPVASEASTGNLERFFQTVNSDSLWVPEHGDHRRWVTDLKCALLNSGSVTDDLLRLLSPICELRPEFCEMVLPFLVHNVLVAGIDDHWEVVSNRISGFFQTHCETVSGGAGRGASCGDSKAMTGVCCNKESVQTMLHVVQYLRQQKRPRRGRKVLTPWDDNFWLQLNYLEVAKAALYCSAPFTAILYAEIWSDSCSEDDKDSSSGSRSQRLSQPVSQDQRLDTLSSIISSSSAQLNVQELLLEAYQIVGDPDGVYGCGAGRLADSTSRIKTYLHENRLEKAVVTFDIGMKMGQPTEDMGLLKTLQSFGADYLLELCLTGKVGETGLSPALQEVQYEAAWRAGQWNLDVPARVGAETGFHQKLYCAMDALKDDQLKLAQASIHSARQSTLQVIDTHLESCRSVYPVLSRLHSLFHLQQMVDAVASPDPDVLTTLLEKLTDEQEPVNEFEFLQPVWDVKCAALKILARKYQQRDLNGVSVSSVLCQQLQNMAEFARREGRYQVAERIIAELRQQENEDRGFKLQLEIEEARLYWARDEQNTAKHLMKSLIGKLEKIQDECYEAVRLLPQALGTYGNWLAETRTENPSVILENYLEKTVELLESSSDGDMMEAYLSLAQFVDTQYQNIVNYMKSSTFEAKQALMKKAKMDYEAYKDHLSDKDRYLRALDKQGEIDEREVVALEDDRHKFLLKAVENYIKCLKAGDKHDLRTYRLTSLWFDNAASEEVNQLLNSNIDAIKSYKFLPLMYQLAARMSVKETHCPLFQPTLAKILETAAVDHPHHAVSVIMALAHANKDMELFTQARAGRSRTGRLDRTVSNAQQLEEDRVQAAKNMIDTLKENGKVSQIVRHMEVLSVAYIELANTNVEKYKTEKKPILLPFSLMLAKIKSLDDVALPTLEAKVDPAGEYKDIVSVGGFGNTFRLAGGINLPKIITIIGSDGIERRQLVKGRDDLRQDAVMQQVFGMVNSLLKKNPETKKRCLRIRMYKVVPLSQRSGVLEWCEGTQPLGEYLVGSKGAHPKYRPHDITALDCRKLLSGVRDPADVRNKLKAYREVCQKFKPVFRHFFMENFSDPATWFEKRLAYTRSVATNSIVGYILGLGDRHVMNILIDCNSAELIHIDLGIAFEQGKILPTPETVPFRLTRDIVDGMGITGVEGIFRRCCEKMMEVMHTNQESLLMILQVLLYDPLYTWSLSPQQALNIQNRRGAGDMDSTDLNSTAANMAATDMGHQSERSVESQEQVNKMAERVLLRLQQKLQGIEDGIQLSVSGQVNNLIQEARDPNNLCRLFPGWQPYL
ncbi:serine-protein kinase ATM-like [Haliotis cracherodii]|uniref:serine-protein kinase ATM-like n=1 Tax=Haliotis cracherodii TaxID=6455 RepID=UPI0039E7A81C